MESEKCLRSAVGNTFRSKICEVDLWKSGGRRNRCRNRLSCGVASVDPHGNHASAEARMAVWCCFIPVCALWVALREYDFGKGLFF